MLSQASAGGVATGVGDAQLEALPRERGGPGALASSISAFGRPASARSYAFFPQSQPFAYAVPKPQSATNRNALINLSAPNGSPQLC
jgi:hypothetical protein